MEEKEKKLFFFDNYYEMEREKRKRYIAWRKTFPPKTGSLWGTHIKAGLKDPNVTSRQERLKAKREKAQK